MGLNHLSYYISKYGLYFSTMSASDVLLPPTVFILTLAFPSFILTILYVFSKKPLYRSDDVVPAYAICNAPKFHIHGLCLCPQITKSTPD